MKVFVDVLSAHRNMNWKEVMRGLDHPSLVLVGVGAVRLLFDVHMMATKKVFPVYDLLLTSNWKNLLAQVQFLSLLLSPNDDLFSFSETANQLSTSLDRPSNSPPRIGCWFSSDLVERLLLITSDEEAGEEVYSAVSGLFDFPLKHCPDVLVLCLVETPSMREAISLSSPSSRPKSKVGLGWTLFSILISSFLTTNHRSALLILHSLWVAYPHLVVRGMADVYQHQPSQITRLFDITQELKGLKRVLDTAPIIFSIDMATLAGRRGYLNLETWLIQNVTVHQRHFVSACVRYLWDRSGEGEGGGGGSGGGGSGSGGGGLMSSTHLTNDVRGVILKVLQGYTSYMIPSIAEDFKKLSLRYLSPSSVGGQGGRVGAGNGGTGGSSGTGGASGTGISRSPVVGGGAGGVAGLPTTTSPTATAATGGQGGGGAPGGGAPGGAPGGAYPPPSSGGINSSANKSTSPAQPAPPDTQKSFPPDIEETANAYFQQIYTSQLSIEDAIDLLSRCKNSASARFGLWVWMGVGGWVGWSEVRV